MVDVTKTVLGLIAQALSMQAFGQHVVSPHSPWDVQLWNESADTQRVSLGVHAWQASSTQTLAHALGALQLPCGSQVRISFSEKHCTASDVHDVHMPPLQVSTQEKSAQVPLSS